MIIIMMQLCTTVGTTADYVLFTPSTLEQNDFSAAICTKFGSFEGAIAHTIEVHCRHLSTTVHRDECHDGRRSYGKQ